MTTFCIFIFYEYLTNFYTACYFHKSCLIRMLRKGTNDINGHSYTSECHLSLNITFWLPERSICLSFRPHLMEQCYIIHSTNFISNFFMLLISKYTFIEEVFDAMYKINNSCYRICYHYCNIYIVPSCGGQNFY